VCIVRYSIFIESSSQLNEACIAIRLASIKISRRSLPRRDDIQEVSYREFNDDEPIPSLCFCSLPRTSPCSRVAVDVDGG
jgi:hypothetical protein